MVKVSARRDGPILTCARALATCSEESPSSRREFERVLRRWAKAARTTLANRVSSFTWTGCLRITRVTTAEPTSGRGRKQLVETWKASEASAEYCTKIDRIP